MSKFFKYLLIIFSILILFIIVLSVTVYVKYTNVEKKDLPVKFLKIVVKPADKDVFLGSKLSYDVFFSVPWNKKPLSSEVNLGKGSQIIIKPHISKDKYEWGYSIWKIHFEIQPYIDGYIPEGCLKTDFLSNTYANQILTVKYPPFVSKNIATNGGTLLIADKVKPKKLINESNFMLYMIISVIVIICIIVLVIILLKKNKNKPIILTPWALAMQNLKMLNDRFSINEISSGKCMSKLTDIVREYLESRFTIKAQRQTTAEFLKSMEEANSNLDNKDRNFLKEFMTSADMVKFAKYDASKELIVNSIERASMLVKETVPDENVNSEKNKID
jgi:hypothetical protein